MKNFSKSIPAAIITCIILIFCTGYFLFIYQKSIKQVHTIGVLPTVAFHDVIFRNCKVAMLDMDYKEDENIKFIYYGSLGNEPEKIKPIVDDMIASKVDIIFAMGTKMTHLVKALTDGTNIPIVFTSENPLEAGIVDNLLRPGGNLTGIYTEPSDERRFELLTQIFPNIKKIYIPFDPTDKASIRARTDINHIIPQLKIEPIFCELHNNDEVNAALTAIPEGVEAIFLIPDTLVGNQRRKDFIQVALNLKIPISSQGIPEVETDALLAYGPDLKEAGMQMARITSQIIKGVSPGDLPCEKAHSLIGINLKFANTIGITIPENILMQVDYLIR
ncbi:MAG: ABC transporter substrate-binding protein [Desulfobacterales bacterium]|nr:ABC transporter substrate-binding protein [Desulfobacterales bacterium]